MPSSNNDKPSPLEILLNKKNGSSNSDCDRPACEDTVSALTSALNRLNKKQKKVGTSSNNSNTTVACPPSKDRIGSSSWTLLHSMVSYLESYLGCCVSSVPTLYHILLMRLLLLLTRMYIFFSILGCMVS